jgi:hypothetical protein
VHGELGPVDDGGAVRFTPEPGYTGADAFGYVASDDDGDSGPGHVITIPGDCTVDPRTNACIVIVGCQPGGDISGCTGHFSQAPARARHSALAAAAASVRRSPKLLKAGRAKQRPKRKRVVRVRIRVSAGGHVIESRTQRFVCRAKKHRSHHH